jgi:hypothetical protein
VDFTAAVALAAICLAFASASFKRNALNLALALDAAAVTRFAALRSEALVDFFALFFAVTAAFFKVTILLRSATMACCTLASASVAFSRAGVLTTGLFAAFTFAAFTFAALTAAALATGDLAGRPRFFATGTTFFAFATGINDSPQQILVN